MLEYEYFVLQHPECGYPLLNETAMDAKEGVVAGYIAKDIMEKEEALSETRSEEQVDRLRGVIRAGYKHLDYLKEDKVGNAEVYLTQKLVTLKSRLQHASDHGQHEEILLDLRKTLAVMRLYDPEKADEFWNTLEGSAS